MSSPTISVPSDVAALAQRVGGHDGSSWFHQCHAAAIEIVKSGLFPRARVARGHARGVGLGQHSWIVLPREGWEGNHGICYDPHSWIIDPTLWSYDESVPGIWEGRNLRLHTPHGTGYLKTEDLFYFDGQDADVLAMPKEIAESLSYRARDFLLKVGAIQHGSRRVALPARYWMHIANAPVQGWPSPEITSAMWRTPQVRGLMRYDIVGMITDHNPGGLYLPSEETS